MGGDYTFNKIEFVNTMNFLITKFNPDAAKYLDKGPVPGVKPFKSITDPQYKQLFKMNAENFQEILQALKEHNISVSEWFRQEY